MSSWQDITALSIVSAALVYLAWRVWGVVRKKRGSCGGCDTCAGNEPPTLVTLDALKPPPGEKS